MKILKANLLKTAGLVSISALIANSAHAISASSMAIKVGTADGRVAALAAASEGKVVKLYTNGKGKLTVNFSFTGVPSGQRLQARFKQQTSANKFTFRLANGNGSFTNLGVTTGLGYKDLNFALPASASGTLLVQLISSVGSDDADLDFLAISGNSTTPPVVVVPPPVVTPPVTPPVVVPPPTDGTLLGIQARATWYWQLQGAINTNVNVAVYDIDLFDTSASQIAALKQKGHALVCYFSAGTYENWRPDASSFTADGLGANMEDWPGERWLDVRKASVRRVMDARLDMAKSKGCDAVEPDNVDGFDNKNGVGLTKADQIAYNSYLADAAHARGLLIALKNSTDLVSALVNKFDFAVVEECFAYSECEAYTPFIQQNKAVLNAEYSKFSTATCTKAKQLGLSTVFFNLDLNGKVFNPCP